MTRPWCSLISSLHFGTCVVSSSLWMLVKMEQWRTRQREWKWVWSELLGKAKMEGWMNSTQTNACLSMSTPVWECIWRIILSACSRECVCLHKTNQWSFTYLHLVLHMTGSSRSSVPMQRGSGIWRLTNARSIYCTLAGGRSHFEPQISFISCCWVGFFYLDFSIFFQIVFCNRINVK